jgi:hypothetical protein
MWAMRCSLLLIDQLNSYLPVRETNPGLPRDTGGDPYHLPNEDNLKYQFYFQPQNKTDQVDIKPII